MSKSKVYVLFIYITILLYGCKYQQSPLFTTLKSSKTGIDFINKNIDRDTLGILDYLYFYNGAGVAIGDINNDGLPDIFFSSNTDGNRLYLNKGNFKFEDITAKSGVKGNADWETGVTMADVNGDGFLDIYVCAVGNLFPLIITVIPIYILNIHKINSSSITGTIRLRKVQKNTG